MITYDNIIDAQWTLVKNWEESGKRVIEETASATPFDGSFKDFLSHCTACGGNWGGMLLSGIRELWPKVYHAIPDDMGIYAFACICSVLLLCNVDTTSED